MARILGRRVAARRLLAGSAIAASLALVGGQGFLAAVPASAGASTPQQKIPSAPKGADRVTVEAGTGQAASVGSVFRNRLVVRVTDSSGKPVGSDKVVFQVPTEGPSASFARGNAASRNGGTVVYTNRNGIAIAPAPRANGLVGHYQVDAFAAGVHKPAAFGLTNQDLSRKAGQTSSTSGATAHASTFAPTTGTITGTVTNSTPAAIAGVCVNVFDSTNSYATATAADGTYTVSNVVPATDYVVQFDAVDCGAGNYVTQWYNNKTSQISADLVSVTGGSNTPNINAAMQPGATISGTVTSAATSSALPNVCVAVIDPSSNLGGSATTASDGTYTVIGLPAGSYMVQFDATDCGAGNYATQWYNNQTSQATANSVPVSAGSTVSGINAAMQAGATISGSVTSATTSSALASVCVYVFDSSFNMAGTSTTAVDGSYSVTGLSAGSFTVQFDAMGCGGGNYITQWYDNQTDQFSANPVPLTAGGTASGINAAMQPGATISGTVTAASTASVLPSVCVDLFDSNSTFAGSANTATDGTYSVTGLPAGSYTVYFDAADCGAGNYAWQWYNNQTSQTTANPVPVTAGATASGINAALQSGATITGTVTSAATTAGLAGVCVTAIDGSGGAGGSTTVTGGSYSVDGLPAGTYKVLFDAIDCSGGNYLTQWYNNQTSATSANPVPLAAGATASGINAALQPGATISGTVTSAATTSALSGVCVDVFDSGLNFVAGATTAADGTYSAGGLVAGSYTVEFDAVDCSGANYITQWYNNQTSQTSATAVPVAAGGTASGINAAMQAGATITGTVTSATTSSGLGGVCVTIMDTGSGASGFGFTAPDGTYSVTGLPAGSYTVQFDAFDCGGGNYATQWFNDQTSQASANLVPVTAGATVPNINATMAALTYVPMTPYRVLDTRNGTGTAGNAVAPIGANSSIPVQITGVDGIPANATAVAINVTAVNATATGTHLIVWPDGASMPNSSNLNIHSPASIANFDIVGLGTGGKIDIYNYAGSVDVIADIGGYYTGSSYTPLTPFRVLDTRDGTGTVGNVAAPIGANSSIPVQITGVDGIPTNATAVAMNVTAVNATATGTHLIVWPDGASMPNSSNLNIHSPASIANFDVVALGTGGKVDIYNYAGTVDVISDIAGYYTGSAYVPLVPYRALDTRNGIGAPAAQVGPGGVVTLQIVGVDGIPSNATAVALNLTAVNATAAGTHLIVWPDFNSMPTASNLNVHSPASIANFDISAIGPDGAIDISNYAGNIDIIADIAGYQIG